LDIQWDNRTEKSYKRRYTLIWKKLSINSVNVRITAFQTGCGAHPASHPIGAGSSSSGDNAAGA